MKLGHSIWTTSRTSHGGTVASDTSAMNDTDANEPLLTNHQSSNIVTEYYAQTRAVYSPGGISNGSYIGQCPSRTICSPQHPSQDLIEMLNRVSLIREEANNQDRQQQQLQHEQQQLLKRQTDRNDFHSAATECTQLFENKTKDITTDKLKQDIDIKAEKTDEESQQDEETINCEIDSDVEPNSHITTGDGMLNGTLLSSNNSVSSSNCTLSSQEDVEDLENDVLTDDENEERKSLLS